MSARAPGLAMHEGPFNHRLLLPLKCAATVSLSEQVLLPILSHAMMYNISQRGESQLTCILPCNQYRQAAAVRGRMGRECVLKPSNAEAKYFSPKHKEAKIFENHLNPVMLVFIGQLLMSTLR